jgi:hypothetical protein
MEETMITANDIRDNIELSANGWAGISTLRSDHIRAIRLMAQLTHNTCAGCGEAIGHAPHLAHIVAATGDKGIAANNVYVACGKECNDIDREVFNGDPFLIVSGMVRRDLILETIPSRAEALAFLAGALTNDGDKARKIALRLAAGSTR